MREFNIVQGGIIMDKLYEEWKLFIDTKECESIEMDDFTCIGCKFNEKCEEFDLMELEER